MCFIRHFNEVKKNVVKCFKYDDINLKCHIDFYSNGDDDKDNEKKQKRKKLEQKKMKKQRLPGDTVFSRIGTN